MILDYAGLASTISNGALFFHDSIYMHVRVMPVSASISVGDSVQMTADSFYSGGLGGGGPWLLGGTGHIPIAKPTNGAVAWASNQPSIANHLSGGWFRGVSAGTTWVRARPNIAASTRTRWWYPFWMRGDSVALVVNPAPPPPPPPLVVTADEMPIHTAGLHEFTAHIGSSGSTINWEIDDSRTPLVAPDTVMTTNGQVLWSSVGHGSYNLQFKVSLAGGSGVQYQDIPVCTEDSGPDLWSGVSGGGSTDAVEHCPPPGGGAL